MIGMIKKYYAMSFENKTVIITKFSIFLNVLLAIGKFILAIFEGVFLFIAGLLNIFIMISKLECYLGIKYPNKKSFQYRNKMIGFFLMLAGLQYSIYMGRMIFTDIELMKYNEFIGILIATFSFVELGIAIMGCFKSYGKGHYYRNIKLINLCSALTAIVLTEVAIMSFANEVDTRKLDGMFGLLIGLLIIIISIFILIAPKISLVGKEHNVYIKVTNDSILENDINIQLTTSKIYGNYFYQAILCDNIIEGDIVKTKSPIFKWNIFLKITVIILAEILIFPYAIFALIFYFKNVNLINKLDEKMERHGYIKINKGVGRNA